jgi:hypothetical protein
MWVGERGGVYEFGVKQFPDFPMLRLSLAAELVQVGQNRGVKQVVKMACDLATDLRLLVLGSSGA